MRGGMKLIGMIPLMFEVGFCGSVCGYDSTFVCDVCGRELCCCQEVPGDTCRDCARQNLRRTRDDVERSLALGERYE